MAFPGSRTHKIQITVDNTKVTGGAHAGYPVGLINSLPAHVFSNAQSDGGCLRFTSDEAGSTKLPCEVVSFTPGSSTCQIWVPATVQNGTNTTLWLWYGGSGHSQPTRTANPDSDGFQGRDYVWDANFMLVVHGESSLADSTSYNRTPANNTGAPTFTTQQVGNGSSWNNASMSNWGRITQLDAPTELTQEMWALTTDSGLVYDFLAGKRTDQGVSGSFNILTNNTTSRDPYFQVNSGGTNYTALATGQNLLNTRRYVAGYYKGSTHVRIRVDSTTVTNTSGIPASLPSNTYSHMIGALLNGIGNPNNFFTGTIDEYRLSNIDRGVNWTDTAQENMRNPSTFVSYGSPVALGGPSPRRVPPALLALL